MKPLRYILLACLVLTSCISEEQYDNTPRGNLDALWTIIDQNYCFLDYKQQELGFNWAQVRIDYRQRLSDKMSNAQLFEVLADMLSTLRDGHVNLYAAHDVGRNWSWYEEYPRNFDPLLQDAYLGTDYKIASGLSYRILPDNIGYVVCPSFANVGGDGNISEVLYALRLCRGLILDIRGNGGGNLTEAQRLARRFTNERRLVGYVAHKTGPGHTDFSEPEAEYLEPSPYMRWQKAVVVLTNRQCYSAANNFVRDMKQCPLVTILGDQTGGGSGFPFSSELPIGWSVRFSSAPSYDADMQHIEFGIQPDTLVTLSDDDAQRGIDTLIEAARDLISRSR
ncbi:MAG: S41 family peptidase [Bacteroidaceae bacterium]|nr:S41 family peptidase [Bacteroidaceae bacterium]